ncbi:MAG: dicarboxylate/amino acid:cation symporter [Bacteroidales bacterium]|nr:dicarboxylate/amino acid:cation symporter [Bacteroidales bacterium]
MKKVPLYIQIFIAIFLGIIIGLISVYTSSGEFIINWIKPWGDIFMRLLKMIAVPLIIVSLINGLAGLSDLAKLSSMGLKTIGMYLITTLLAVSIGLLIVNITKPGKLISENTQSDLTIAYAGQVEDNQEIAFSNKQRGPLHFIVEIIPENIIESASSNRNMLQLIFLSLFVGIATVVIPKNKTASFRKIIEELNDIVLWMIDKIMLFSPIGVLALMSGIIVDVAGNDINKTVELFSALAWYAFSVVIGLLILIFILYPILINIITKKKYFDFLKAILPAQLLGFSTSSSAATLPVTMECAEDNLKLKKEVSSFVLPLGATINMDGTSLYQAVAAVFIAQAFGMELTMFQQLTIVITATLASIGSAAVPGAGIVMLVVVLESIGVPSIGIALILAPDRPLDMLRTTTNLTGDLMIASLVDKWEASAKKNHQKS